MELKGPVPDNVDELLRIDDLVPKPDEAELLVAPAIVSLVPPVDKIFDEDGVKPVVEFVKSAEECPEDIEPLLVGPVTRLIELEEFKVLEDPVTVDAVLDVLLNLDDGIVSDSLNVELRALDVDERIVRDGRDVVLLIEVDGTVSDGLEVEANLVEDGPDVMFVFDDDALLREVPEVELSPVEEEIVKGGPDVMFDLVDATLVKGRLEVVFVLADALVKENPAVEFSTVDEDNIRDGLEVILTLLDGTERVMTDVVLRPAEDEIDNDGLEDAVKTDEFETAVVEFEKPDVEVSPLRGPVGTVIDPVLREYERVLFVDGEAVSEGRDLTPVPAEDLEVDEPEEVTFELSDGILKDGRVVLIGALVDETFDATLDVEFSIMEDDMVKEVLIVEFRPVDRAIVSDGLDVVFRWVEDSDVAGLDVKFRPPEEVAPVVTLEVTFLDVKANVNGEEVDVWFLPIEDAMLSERRDVIFLPVEEGMVCEGLEDVVPTVELETSLIDEELRTPEDDGTADDPDVVLRPLLEEAEKPARELLLALAEDRLEERIFDVMFPPADDVMLNDGLEDVAAVDKFEVTVTDDELKTPDVVAFEKPDVEVSPLRGLFEPLIEPGLRERVLSSEVVNEKVELEPIEVPREVIGAVGRRLVPLVLDAKDEVGKKGGDEALLAVADEPVVELIPVPLDLDDEADVGNGAEDEFREMLREIPVDGTVVRFDRDDTLDDEIKIVEEFLEDANVGSVLLLVLFAAEVGGAVVKINEDEFLEENLVE